MTYLDSSALLKLFWREPESSAIVQAVGREPIVVISSLTQLETLSQLKAAHLAGEYSLAVWRRLELQFSALRNQAPFEFRDLPASLFASALRQHRNSARVHCRTLDRLHLAAMEELALSRLMTHDQAQATAALALGFAVTMPGREPLA